MKINEDDLKAFNKGIMTDEQLDNIIKFYSNLVESLKCIDSYYIAWKCANESLNEALAYKRARGMKF